MRLYRLDLFLLAQIAIPGLIVARLRTFQAGLESAWINSKQQIAGLDELVILYRQPDNWCRYTRRDLYNLGTHLAVPGPGIHDVIPVFEKYQDYCNQDDRASQ